MLGKANATVVKAVPPVPRDGGEGEGEGSQGDEFDVNTALQHPDIQAAIQAAIDNEVSGLKNKNSELLDKFKKASEAAKKVEGLDIERLTTLQKQMEENEEMKLLAEGKVEEVVTRRVELLQKDHLNEIEARDGKIKELEGVLSNKENRLRELVVDGTVREAYVSLDYEPAAMPDMIRNARDTFIMDEDGNVMPRDTKGNVIFSKDGKTPIDAKTWLEIEAEKRPYLRRQSAGGGSQGGGRQGAGLDKLSSTGKIVEGLKKMGLQ